MGIFGIIKIHVIGGVENNVIMNMSLVDMGGYDIRIFAI